MILFCDVDSVFCMCGSVMFVIVLLRVWISVVSMIDRVSIGWFRVGEVGVLVVGFKWVFLWSGCCGW